MARPRKSAAFKTLAGTIRQDRLKPEDCKSDADALPAGRPKCPKSVKADPEAKAAWRSAVKILELRGTLTPGDAPTLTVFALCSARYLKANADVAERGFEIEVTRTKKNGDTYTTFVPNPSLKILDSCERQLLALARTLGMTPADRTKVKRTTPHEGGLAVMPTPGTMWAEHPEFFDAKGNPKR